MLLSNVNENYINNPYLDIQYILHTYLHNRILQAEIIDYK